jgi:hemin uptake protein HemP
VNAPSPSADVIPAHDALMLTAGGKIAHILLGGQTYALRITRQGKLILTK